jgi:hypothetical protein
MSSRRLRSRTRHVGRARKAFGLLCVSAGILAANLSGSSVSHAGPAVPAAWSKPASIPSAKTNVAPALTEFHGDIYAAWIGYASPYRLWYSAFNGATWTKPLTVPSAVTMKAAVPELAVYSGKLYAAWIATSSPSFRIMYSAFDGTTWTPPKAVPSALSDGSGQPLAAFNGELYVVWSAESSRHIMYSVFNGTTWTSPTPIAGVVAVSPALAVYKTKLYGSWRTNQILYASFNGKTWSASAPVTSKNYQSTLALAVSNKKLYEAFTDLNGSHVDYASFSGTSWTSVKTIPSSGNCAGAGLVGYGTALFAAWVSPNCTTTGPIDYSSGP